MPKAVRDRHHAADLANAAAAMLALPQDCPFRNCRRRQRCCLRNRRTDEPFCLTRLSESDRHYFDALLDDAQMASDWMHYNWKLHVSRDPEVRERQDAAIEIAFIVLFADRSRRPALRAWRRRHAMTALPPHPPGPDLDGYRETVAFIASRTQGRW